MNIDKDLLLNLENSFLPHDPNTLPAHCEVLGYGEISTVLGIDQPPAPPFAVKRIPLFENETAAREYCLFFERYNTLLREAGLEVPDCQGLYVPARNDKYTAYLAQQRLNPASICHKLIHRLPDDQALLMVRMILHQTKKVWDYQPKGIRLGLDGQLSNWAVQGNPSHIDESTRYWYLDTSTPFIRENGRELLDKSMFMKSAPVFLRPVLYLLAQGIIERYYDLRAVIVDLLANLIKEKKSDILDGAIAVANTFLDEEAAIGTSRPITRREVRKYYNEDKLTWDIYLRFRRFDRWMRTRILGAGYEFLLPGRIER